MTWQIFMIACFLCAGVGLIFWIGFMVLISKNDDLMYLYFRLTSTIDGPRVVVAEYDEKTFDLWLTNTKFLGQLQAQRLKKYIR